MRLTKMYVESFEKSLIRGYQARTLGPMAYEIAHTMFSAKSEEAKDENIQKVMTFATHRVEKMNNNGEEK